MAQWQMTLDFSKEKRQYRNNEITLQQLAQFVVDKIKESLPQAKLIDRDMARELEDEIMPNFEDVADRQDSDVDDFDNALSSLYDWADTKLDGRWNGRVMCWIVP